MSKSLSPQEGVAKAPPGAIDENLCSRSTDVRHLKRRSQRPHRPSNGVTWYAHLYKRLGLVQLEGWTPLR